MGDGSLELIKGTLDVLILKTLSWRELHGYGVSKAIRGATDEAFQVEEGALYPALRRLEKRGLIESEWGVTDTGREAKYYRLTREGRRALESEVRSWSRYVEAMSRVLFAEGPPT
jgi:transcriptional regulator